MTSFGFTTAADYDASFTPAAISEFREFCSTTVDTLQARGIQPKALVVSSETVEIPRSFLGLKLKPGYRREERVLLRGWELLEVQTLMGQSGDEWYQWKVSAALGEDGRLYRVERHREERNGIPASDDGSVRVSPLEDAQLALFDVMDPSKFEKESPDGYWAPFPRRLRGAVSELLG